ncbi:MAG: hypothetical protein JXA77_04280 [Bacteroidales bacterium]|nr:hypothetical protein [Bacteroidales bacterium]MBN2819771.1 hypothetical protein [Bacteroidales bacterium]
MKKIFILLVFYSAISYGQIDFPEIDNWKKGKIETYNSENLWECINGAADYYLNYGFEKLEVAEYLRTEDEYLKVEIYQHKDNLNTYGIYAYERYPDAEFLNIGSEGYINHSALNFYTGNWYVKIHSHQSDDQTIEAIKLLADKVSQLQGESTGKPAAVQKLPEEHYKPYTTKYYPSNYMGLSFLNNVVAADYENDGQKYNLFISEQESPEDALLVIQKYLDFSKTDLKAEADKVFEIDDLFNGKVFLLAKDNVLSGSIGLDKKDEASAIINMLLE